MHDNGKEKTDGSMFGHGVEGLRVVKALLLMEVFCDEASFVMW